MLTRKPTFLLVVSLGYLLLFYHFTFRHYKQH